MITTEGSIYVKRYLAQQVPNIAQSIAVGVGNASESAGQNKLQFEVGRADITLVSYDFVNDHLIFKASVPEEIGGKVYEAALFSLSEAATNAEFGSKLLTTFDSSTEEWVDATTLADATYNTVNGRIGPDALRQQPAASGTKTDALKDVMLDLSGYSAADQFVLALNAANGNASSVRLRFLTDVNNYYELNYGAPVTGYNVLEATKGTATPTGTPSWDNITEIRVTTNSSATGQSFIDFDGLRVDDTDTVNADDIMVARKVLVTPFTKIEGMTQEIEFALDINVL